MMMHLEEFHEGQGHGTGLVGSGLKSLIRRAAAALMMDGGGRAAKRRLETQVAPKLNGHHFSGARHTEDREETLHMVTWCQVYR